MFKKLSRPEKAAKKANKQSKENRKRIATTLQWIDVDSIKDDTVYLKKGKKQMLLKGIKVNPKNIFIENAETVHLTIDRWRIFFNKFPFEIYWEFVFNPVDLDLHLVELDNELKYCEDKIISSMIQNDIAKAVDFCETHKELEFFMIINAKDEEEMEKHFFDMIHELNNEGISYSELRNKDFYNLISSVFENEMITQYKFNEGVFRSYLVDDFNEDGELIYSEENEKNKSERKEDLKVKVRAKWKRESENELPRIDVNLLANGFETDLWINLNKDNEWQDAFVELPYFDDNGGIIEYSIKINDNQGFELNYEFDDDTLVVLFEDIQKPIEKMLDKKEEKQPEFKNIKVRMKWAEEDEMPDEVLVYLVANQMEINRELILCKDNNWIGFFTKLPIKDRMGDTIQYEVLEQSSLEFSERKGELVYEESFVGTKK